MLILVKASSIGYTQSSFRMAQTRKNVSHSTSTLAGLTGTLSVVCVAGAGRGPLVARCLSAVARSKRDVFIYAVEKNPNAFVGYVIIQS